VKFHGTYHIDSDGSGVASYAATSASGDVSQVELQLHVISRDQVKFQSPGWENRDWSSVTTQMQSGNAGLIGEMRGKFD
jgi:hypothetical protein